MNHKVSSSQAVLDGLARQGDFTEDLAELKLGEVIAKGTIVAWLKVFRKFFPDYGGEN